MNQNIEFSGVWWIISWGLLLAIVIAGLLYAIRLAVLKSFNQAFLHVWILRHGLLREGEKLLEADVG
jgi:hypothetical protein